MMPMPKERHQLERTGWLSCVASLSWRTIWRSTYLECIFIHIYIYLNIYRYIFYLYNIYIYIYLKQFCSLLGYVTYSFILYIHIYMYISDPMLHGWQGECSKGRSGFRCQKHGIRWKGQHAFHLFHYLQWSMLSGLQS